MNDLSALRCFQAVYTTLNLSVAAKKLGLSKASVSKKIQGLEIDLGGPLFIRSTRQIVPTKEAEILFGKVDQLLSTLSEIETLFTEEQILKGKIRITSGHSMAQRFLGELLLDFQLEYPEVEIEFVVTDNVLDPIENNIDLSLRVNPPGSSPLVGKKVGAYQLHLVATPKYLRANPIKKVEDLSHHAFFAIEPHLQTVFENSGKKVTTLTQKRAYVCNDSIVIGKFIRDDKGIGIRSNWDIKKELKEGTLKEVLPQQNLKQSGDVWLLSHPSKLKVPRVNALFKFLEERLKGCF